MSKTAPANEVNDAKENGLKQLFDLLELYKDNEIRLGIELNNLFGTTYENGFKSGYTERSLETIINQ
jgi:hypothetical protein